MSSRRNLVQMLHPTKPCKKGRHNLCCIASLRVRPIAGAGARERECGSAVLARVLTGASTLAESSIWMAYPESAVDFRLFTLNMHVCWRVLLFLTVFFLPAISGAQACQPVNHRVLSRSSPRATSKCPLVGLAHCGTSYAFYYACVHVKYGRLQGEIVTICFSW